MAAAISNLASPRNFGRGQSGEALEKFPSRVSPPATHRLAYAPRACGRALRQREPLPRSPPRELVPRLVSPESRGPPGTVASFGERPARSPRVSPAPVLQTEPLASTQSMWGWLSQPPAILRVASEGFFGTESEQAWRRLKPFLRAVAVELRGEKRRNL